MVRLSPHKKGFCFVYPVFRYRCTCSGPWQGRSDVFYFHD